MAAQVAHERQIWLKLLASPPAGYPESGCCRAPVLPLLTRDVSEAGLICEHCGEMVVEKYGRLAGGRKVCISCQATLTAKV